VNLKGSFVPGQLTVHHDPAVVTKVSKALRAVGRKVALVPTMGALHEGHLHLVRQARKSNSVVIVSIFVNPLQFGANEDLDAYPRTLEADIELLKGEGVEIVFAPSANDMYPNGPRTMIHPGPTGADLEGKTRPTHFAGMLTVVAKLFQIAQPNTAYFGEKDYQQLALIRQMVRDVNFDLKVIGVPTVREKDGLALSSRNRYLREDERESALALSAALLAGARSSWMGPEAALEAAREVLAAVPAVQLDYLEVRGKDLGEVPEYGEARMLIAAKVGTTRLIDNVGIVIGGGEADAQKPLEQASVR
jgi:pantoate--beta-alanine ligase